MAMPKLFSKCLKDGRQITGIFELVYDEKRQPAVVVDTVKIGGKNLARTLTINPQWLRKVQKTDYEFVYDGVIDIWKSERN
jgi:hypothetical protein